MGGRGGDHALVQAGRLATRHVRALSGAARRRSADLRAGRCEQVHKGGGLEEGMVLLGGLMREEWGGIAAGAKNSASGPQVANTIEIIVYDQNEGL